MFDRVLNMPHILNMPAFWIYGSSEYTGVANMPEFCICLCFWMCQGSRYTAFLNLPRVTQYLNMPESLNNSWICLIMPESTWICLNGFCFTFTHCNSLSKWTIDFFLQSKFSWEIFFCSNWKYLILFIVLD